MHERSRFDRRSTGPEDGDFLAPKRRVIAVVERVADEISGEGGENRGQVRQVRQSGREDYASGDDPPPVLESENKGATIAERYARNLDRLEIGHEPVPDPESVRGERGHRTRLEVLQALRTAPLRERVAPGSHVNVRRKRERFEIDALRHVSPELHRRPEDAELYVASGQVCGEGERIRT